MDDACLATTVLFDEEALDVQCEKPLGHDGPHQWADWTWDD